MKSLYSKIFISFATILFIVALFLIAIEINKEIRHDAYVSIEIFADTEITKILDNNLKYEYKKEYDKCLEIYNQAKKKYNTCKTDNAYLFKINKSVCDYYLPVKDLICKNELVGYPTFPPNEYYISPGQGFTKLITTGFQTVSFLIKLFYIN